MSEMYQRSTDEVWRSLELQSMAFRERKRLSALQGMVRTSLRKRTR